jgi:hypothetical protein
MEYWNTFFSHCSSIPLFHYSTIGVVSFPVRSFRAFLPSLEENFWSFPGFLGSLEGFFFLPSLCSELIFFVF